MNNCSAGLLPERYGVPASPNLARRRAGMNTACEAGLWATDPEPETLFFGDIRALSFAPASPARATLLHMHGGGFRIGCPEAVGPFAAKLAERCSIEVICPEYRLAPEYPFPAGLNDGWQVLAALAHRNSIPILLSGDSAGGALATALASLALRHKTQIRALALLSPWLDLTNHNSSFETNRDNDAVYSKEDADAAAAGYLQGHTPEDPIASPAFCDLVHFPATYLNSGAGEVLVDDVLKFSSRLTSAGIPVTCNIVPAMEHVAVTRDMALPGATQAFDTLAAFIDEALSAA